MWKRFQAIGYLLTLVAFSIVAGSISRFQSAWAADSEEARARITKEFSQEFRSQALFDNRSEKYISSIGGLAQSPYWTNDLLLAEAQANTLNKLDKLVWEADKKSFLSGADYLDTNPADYQEFIRESHARRRAAVDHAGSMVLVGLLTEPQAALVTQNTLSARRYWLNYLRDQSYLQDLVGITEEQREKLVRLGKKGRAERAKLDWFSVSRTPEESKEFNDKVEKIQQATDIGGNDLLTKRQREILDELAAGPKAPVERPALVALSAAQSAKINVEERSPIFHVLTQQADVLKLSNEQQQFLNDLQEIAKEGIFWIGQRKTSREAEQCTKFIKHAEQVALEGILNPNQAKQVQALATKK